MNLTRTSSVTASLQNKEEQVAKLEQELVLKQQPQPEPVVTHLWSREPPGPYCTYGFGRIFHSRSMTVAMYFVFIMVFKGAKKVFHKS